MLEEAGIGRVIETSQEELPLLVFVQSADLCINVTYQRHQVTDENFTYPGHTHSAITCPLPVIHGTWQLLHGLAELMHGRYWHEYQYLHKALSPYVMRYYANICHLALLLNF